MGKFNDKLRKFAYGRYGADELSRFMSILSLILFVLSIFFRGETHWEMLTASILLYVGIFILLLCIVRTLSKNIVARRKEQAAYLKIKGKITGPFKLMKRKFAERKTHKYYKCPNCKATIRIVKPNKGKTIEIHCPKCGKDFEKRT